MVSWSQSNWSFLPQHNLFSPTLTLPRWCPRGLLQRGNRHKLLALMKKQLPLFKEPYLPWLTLRVWGGLAVTNSNSSWPWGQNWYPSWINLPFPSPWNMWPNPRQSEPFSGISSSGKVTENRLLTQLIWKQLLVTMFSAMELGGGEWSLMYTETKQRETKRYQIA